MATTTAGARIGTILSGRYRLESRLGRGGMSTVYLARDEKLDRLVAVKILHREMSDEPGQLQRFGAEARSAAQLSHPNVVAVIDAGQDDGTPYIVFEHVAGETLKERIQRLGPLGIDEAVAYAIEIGRGLAAAHARKLVHRDIKPQNILIGTDGRAKVTDFGIARSLEGVAEGATGTGRVVGTTDYVSPEQAMGEELDERSDIYSLGVVLYEMLTGEVPYRADSQVGVAVKHVHDQMPDVQARRPDVSAAVAAVIDRSTAKNPRNRYATVEHLLDDLEATLEVEAARRGGTSGEATAVLGSVPKSRRRLTAGGPASRAGVLMGLIGVALIAAALLLGESGGLDGGSGNEVKLAPDAVRAFDPESSGGDGEEHSDEVKLAIDGNPTGTAWQTENYNTPDFGGLGKPGVGIYVDAGDPVTIKAVEVRSADSGWDAEIRAAPGASDAPKDLSDWGVVGSAADIGTHDRISVSPIGGASRFYLVWITGLAESDGGNAVNITDIRLLD